MLLNQPALPGVAPSDTTTAELVVAPLIIIQFLSVTFVVGVVPLEPITTTLGVVVDVFSIVRLLSVQPEFEPSIVI